MNICLPSKWQQIVLKVGCGQIPARSVGLQNCRGGAVGALGATGATGRHTGPVYSALDLSSWSLAVSPQSVSKSQPFTWREQDGGSFVHPSSEPLRNQGLPPPHPQQRRRLSPQSLSAASPASRCAVGEGRTGQMGARYRPGNSLIFPASQARSLVLGVQRGGGRGQQVLARPLVMHPA